MGAPTNAPADTMMIKLNELLSHARTLKQSTSINPPLQVSDLVSVDNSLFEPIVGDKEIHTLAIERAAKAVFYSTIGRATIEDPSFVTVWNLLDILQYCGDRDLCSPQLVLLLIEELLDSQSIAGCRIAFTFLETRREAIITNTSKNKDLVVLRLCNELLRRLSRAEDPVFCGRVYIFLFQSFPLGDKSSVNLRGNFHVENQTTFEDFLATTEPEVHGDQTATEGGDDTVVKGETKVEDATVEGGKPQKGEAKTLDVDKLYPVFWSLQNSFSNPPRLFEEDNFADFQKGLEATLAKFREVPKVIQAGDTERKKNAKSRSDEDDEFASAYNPKYLTSRDLFKLELSDLAFQRHILVQALILIDFLLTLTEKAKKKPYYQNAQKAMQYAFTLRDEDTEWALGIKNSIANYLQDGPDGKFYYRMVDTVLSRDKNWVRWKMENCQPFTRDRVPTSKFLVAKTAAKGDLNRKTIHKDATSKGLIDLSFLSRTDAEKGLSKLKQGDRSNVPSADSYASEVRVTGTGQESSLSETDRRQREEEKSSNSWRGLRLASRTQLVSFDRLEQGKGLERLKEPVASIEAAGEDNAPAEDRDGLPQEQQQHVEEQRPDEQSQVTTSATTE